MNGDAPLASNMWYTNVCQWMQRVATGDSGLPMVVLHGPPGSGKTMGVRAAARASGVALIEIGSDTSGDAHSGSRRRLPLSNRESLNSWIALSKSRPLTPRVICIDDADAVLGDTSVALRDFLRLAANRIAVLLVASDMYVGSLLRDLCRTTSERIVRLRVTAPPNEAIFRLLMQVTVAEKLACKREHVRTIVMLAHGDVRAALLELRHGTLMPRSDDDSLSDLTRRCSVFEHLDTALGVSGHALDDDVFYRHGSLFRRFVQTHYRAAAPDLTTLADVADTYAHIDAVGDMDDYLATVAVPARVRRDQRRLKFFAPRISYAGPPTGRATSEWFNAMREIERKLLPELHALHLFRLHESGRPLAAHRD